MSSAKADLTWQTTAPTAPAGITFSEEDYTWTVSTFSGASLAKSTVSDLVKNDYGAIEYIKITNTGSSALRFFNLDNATIGVVEGKVVYGEDVPAPVLAANGGVAYIVGDFADVSPDVSQPNFFSFFNGSFLSGATLTATIGYVSDTDDTKGTTPEPATMLIFGAGLAGLGIARRRMKK